MRELSLLFAAAASLQAADISTALAPLTGDEIFSRLIEHNRQRESLLRGYSVQRAYSATNKSGTLYAAEEVRMSYAAPDEKTFVTLSARGSWLVRDLVFSRLMQTEAATARGKERNDSSITPANYRFEALGGDEVGGRPCYVVQAIPLRKNKYLFAGRVWVDAGEFAIARIAARPASNPSFWIRHVEFVRTFSKVGSLWLPSRDETVADIRIHGRKVLTIDHHDYVLNTGDEYSGR
jgi:hypothetical protein